MLQEVNIPIWQNNECRAKYGNAAPGGIVEHFLCAGGPGHDSCSVSVSYLIKTTTCSKGKCAVIPVINVLL